MKNFNFRTLGRELKYYAHYKSIWIIAHFLKKNSPYHYSIYKEKLIYGSLCKELFNFGTLFKEQIQLLLIYNTWCRRVVLHWCCQRFDIINISGSILYDQEFQRALRFHPLSVGYIVTIQRILIPARTIMNLFVRSYTYLETNDWITENF